MTPEPLTDNQMAERNRHAALLRPHLLKFDPWKKDDAIRRLKACAEAMPELTDPVNRMVAAYATFNLASDGLIRGRTQPGKALALPLSIACDPPGWIPRNQYRPAVELFERAAKNLETATKHIAIGREKLKELR